MNEATAMRCDYCHVEMPEWRATIEKPYPYSVSGIKDVYLAGITVRECAKCGVVVPIIPRIGQLHHVIAWSIVKEPRPLRGDEIRFLRKIAGFPARKFANLLGVTPEHLSRVENGKTDSLGNSADRLARAIAIVAKDGERARELFLDIADRLGRQTEDHADDSETPVFQLRPSGWKAAA
jgi:transcriptional regulator with XRE-family HTH domain